jgi:hypothetical protein
MALLAEPAGADFMKGVPEILIAFKVVFLSFVTGVWLTVRFVRWLFRQNSDEFSYF